MRIGGGGVPPVKPSAADESPRPRRWTRYVKIGAATVAFVASLATIYVAVFDRHKKPTLAEWSRRANAVCQQDFAGLAPANTDALDSIAQALAQMADSQASGSLADPSKAAVTHSIAQYIGGFSKMLGDIGLLPSPGSRQSEIESALSAGKVLLARFKELLAALQTVFFNLPDPQGRTDQVAILSDALTKARGAFQTELPNWRTAIWHLNLTECDKV